MTTCTHCLEPANDVDEYGVCSVCQSILKYKKTLEKLGKVTKPTSHPVDRQLPPSDRE